MLQAEKAGQGFQFQTPLGRSWYETSFTAILESGWPLFGLLDLSAKHAVSLGQVVDIWKLQGSAVEHRPVRVPRVQCELQIQSTTESEYRLVWKAPSWTGYGKRRSVKDLALDADTCSLLGGAVVRFQKARAELRRRLTSGWDLEKYQTLSNFSARCPEDFEVLASRYVSRSQCSTESFQDCAALGDQGRVIPRQCMRVLKSPGSGLQIRSKFLLSHIPVVHQLIEEGERLFREFVDRHTLYIAAWTAARPELAPVHRAGSNENASNPDGWPSFEEIKQRDSLFSVLQDIQQELMSTN